MIVVQLVVACLRADAPGFTGGAAYTPEMDRLAAEGTRFERMFVSGSYSVPSLVSMTTGMWPHRVGVARWRHAWPAGQPTLMSAFQSAGFETRLLAYNPRWLFGTCPERGPVGCSQRLDDVVEALRAPRGADRFVLIHHWWTHLPYMAMKLEAPVWKRSRDAAVGALRRDPAGMARKLRSMYLQAVSFISEQLLPVYLDAASSSGNDVLFLLTGDSGEDWGEGLAPGLRIRHHFDLAGHWQRDATTAVPLVVWGKGAGRAIPSSVVLRGIPRGVDLAPTVAELAGVPWPGRAPPGQGATVVDRGPEPMGEDLLLAGRSIAGEITTGQPTPPRPLMVVSTHNTHVPDEYPSDGRRLWRTFGLRTDDRWYVWDGADRRRELRSADGTPIPDEEGDEQLWRRLERQWLGAVDPVTLPKEQFPVFQRRH